MRTDWISTGALAVLTVVWGSSFALTALALGGFAPPAVAAGRIGLSAVALTGIALALRKPLPRDLAGWAWCTALGALALVMPFSLLAWGQQQVPSALAAILVSASPLFMLLLTRTLLGAHVSGRRWTGFAVGFAGIAVLIGPGALLQVGNGAGLLPELACLGAALCYAGSGLLIRRMPPLDPVAATAASQIAAAVLALPMGLAALPETLPGATPLVALAVLGLVQTGFAHMLRYFTVKRAGPVFMSTVGYLIPVFATLVGVTFLDEPLTPRTLAGFALILGGIALARPRPERA